METAKPPTAPGDSYFSLPQRKTESPLRITLFCFSKQKLIFKANILFTPQKVLMKWNKTCTYTSCLGLLVLELPFQQLSVAFIGGWGCQVTTDEQTEIPKQSKFSTLHNSAYFTHPHFKWKVTALNIAELTIFLPKEHQTNNKNNKKPKQKPNPSKNTNTEKLIKNFPWRLLEERTKKPGNGINLPPGTSPAGRPSLKTPKIIELSQPSQQTTPQAFLQANNSLFPN